MCGRYALKAKPEELGQEFSLTKVNWFPPRYNIAPTQPILVLRMERGERELALVRWGLIPGWAKDPAALPLLFNARSETAAEKPAFRDAMRYRRCIVPASGFYEWCRLPGGRKQAYWIAPRDGRILAFAGLWEGWSDAGGNEIDTATILTTAANDDVAAIHDRMPVILPPDAVERWLDPRETKLAGLFAPPPAQTLEAIPIGDRINNARNDDETLQARVEPEAAAAPKEKAPPKPKREDRQLKLF